MSIMNTFPTADQLKENLEKEKAKQVGKERVERMLAKILSKLKKLNEGPVEINWTQNLSRDHSSELRKVIFDFLVKKGYDVEEENRHGSPVLKFRQFK